MDNFFFLIDLYKKTCIFIYLLFYSIKVKNFINQQVEQA